MTTSLSYHFLHRSLFQSVTAWINVYPPASCLWFSWFLHLQTQWKSSVIVGTLPINHACLKLAKLCFIYFQRKYCHVEKSFTFRILFSKKINSLILRKSSGQKLALLCVCQDGHSGVTIFGISLHQSSILLLGFDTNRIFYSLKNKRHIYRFLTFTPPIKFGNKFQIKPVLFYVSKIRNWGKIKLFWRSGWNILFLEWLEKKKKKKKPWLLCKCYQL